MLGSAIFGQLPVAVATVKPAFAGTTVLAGGGALGCAYDLPPPGTAANALDTYVLANNTGATTPNVGNALLFVAATPPRVKGSKVAAAPVGTAPAGFAVAGMQTVQGAANANVTVATNVTAGTANLGTTTSTSTGSGPPSISTTQSSNAEALDYVRERREAQSGEQVQTVASNETVATDNASAGSGDSANDQAAQADTAGEQQPKKKKKAAEAVAEAAAEPAAKAAPKAASKAASQVADEAAPIQAAKAKTVKKIVSKPKPVEPAPETGDNVLTADAASAYGGVRQGSNGYWVQGFGDYERHKNIAPGEASNTTRYQRTAGALVGLDHTFDLSSYGTASALTIGVIGGGLDVKTKFDDTSVFRDSRTSQSGGFVGLYGSYTRGNFSIDGIFKTDLLDHHERRVSIDTTTVTTATAPKTTTVETRSQDCPAGTHRIVAVDQDTGAGVTTTIMSPGQTVTVQATNKDDTVRSTLTLQGLADDQTTTKDAIDATKRTETKTSTVTEHLVQGSVDEVNYNFGTNMYYRVALDDHRYFEPTAGILYTITDYGSGGAALGLDDGRVLRVQGGARIGTKWEGAGGLFYNVSLLGLAYSDVLVEGYTLSPSSLASDASAVDEGKIRALAAFETVIQDLDGHSFQLTAELRGGQDVIGFGGRAAYRIQW